MKNDEKLNFKTDLFTYIDRLVLDFKSENSFKKRAKIIEQLNDYIGEGKSKFILIKRYFFSELLHINSDFFVDYIELMNDRCRRAYEESVKESASLINQNNIIEKVIQWFPDILDFSEEIDWYKKHSITPFIEGVFCKYVIVNKENIDKRKLSDFLELMRISNSELIRMMAEELYRDFLINKIL
jgi:hypothetical protein